MVSSDCGTFTDNTVTTTSVAIMLIIEMNVTKFRVILWLVVVLQKEL